jgi:hypothetical protein
LSNSSSNAAFLSGEVHTRPRLSRLNISPPSNAELVDCIGHNLRNLPFGGLLAFHRTLTIKSLYTAFRLLIMRWVSSIYETPTYLCQPA